MESVAQHVSSDWLIAARSDDAAAPRRHPMSRTGLFTRWRQWLTQLSVRWQAEALDPRMARDIGAAPGNPMPEGYICDPRPLWHIGLAPESIHSAGLADGHRLMRR